MYALNRVTLVGRVGQDPEIRNLENNVSVARFSIAITESYRDKDGNWQNSPTEWHNVVAWRNLAERAKTEIQKGKLIYVEGKLQSRKWEDKDGNARKTIDILARDFRAFEVSSSENSGGGGGRFPTAADDPFANRMAAPAANNSKPSAPATPAAPEPSAFDGDAPDDDLPF